MAALARPTAGARVIRGRVALVGAGPGRPDLLTLRGASLLARADAVVLDALVDRRLLAHCRSDVRIVDAGKRGHGRVLMRQPAINRLLVDLARRGKFVVRLKGGDPYLFGRGGEEAEALARAGVPFEVVPGVSSVTAAPAFAGVPLTHRDLASTVTVVTGHGREPNPYLRETSAVRRGRTPPGVAWDRIPRDGTLVVLMGLARLPEISAALARAGWPADVPSVAVASGTTAEQRVVRAPLGELAAAVRRARLAPPALLVIGRVASLAPRLDWFGARPLAGRTVLVTRASHQAGALSALLEERGARAVESPVLRFDPLPVPPSVRRALRAPGEIDGVIFTSANAVRFAAPHLPRPWPSSAAAYAVGPKTADALRAAGIPVAGVAATFRAEGVARLLGRRLSGRRFLFPHAREIREALADRLRKSGARLIRWPVYETRRVAPSPAVRSLLRGGRVDAVTFTSASTARFLRAGLGAAAFRRLFKSARAASIGPLTTAALRSAGVRRVVQASEATVESLADALARVRWAP